MFKKVFAYGKYLKPQLGTMIFAILAGVISSWASGFGLPLLVKFVFPIVFDDQPLPPEVSEWIIRCFHPDNMREFVLIFTCSFLPFIFLFRGVGMFFNVYLTSIVGVKVLEAIRIDAFSRLQTLPLSFHEKQQKGDLMSRLLNDTANVQSCVTVVANDIIKQPMTLIASLSYLVWQTYVNPHSSLLLLNLFFIALSLIPIKFFGNRLMKKAQLLQEQLGTLTAVAQENLVSQREVRSYGMQEQQVSLFRAMTMRFFHIQLRMIKYRQFLVPVMELVSAIGLGILLVRGQNVGMTYEDFYALALALFMCYDPLKRLGSTFNTLKNAQASLDRLNYILKADDNLPEPENPKNLGRASGHISYNHVDFSYNGEHQVLSDINVEIKPGEVIGLVGPSGAGKTTFASLLPRFYDVSSGSIKMDGLDLRDMTFHDIRKNISLVSQHPVLFRGTIMENIRMGKPGATDLEVIEASKQASAHEFITSMPDGYETELGDGGSGLSGGQRQRVTIARAFLKNAPILILDEATASLDAESESIIQKELDHLVEGRTALIVAHRFSSIKVATRILVFEHGHIIGDGTHEQLYNQCDLYKELFDKQSL